MDLFTFALFDHHMYSIIQYKSIKVISFKRNTLLVRCDISLLGKQYDFTFIYIFSTRYSKCIKKLLICKCIKKVAFGLILEKCLHVFQKDKERKDIL